MPWVRFDDRYTSHAKVAGLSDRAFRVHHQLIEWSAQNLTDGRIPKRSTSGVTRGVTNGVGIHHHRMMHAVTELLEAGLLMEVEGAYVLHDYLDYQPSRSEVEALRSRKKGNSRDYRRRQAKKDAQTGASPGDAESATPPVTPPVENPRHRAPDPEGRVTPSPPLRRFPSPPSETGAPPRLGGAEPPRRESPSDETEIDTRRPEIRNGTKRPGEAMRLELRLRQEQEAAEKAQHREIDARQQAADLREQFAELDKQDAAQAAEEVAGDG